MATGERKDAQLPPTYERQLRAAITAINAVNTEQETTEAFESFLRSPTAQAKSRFLQLVTERHPEALSVGEETLLDICRYAAGPSPLPSRWHGLPGFSGQPLWLLLSQRDIEAMRAELKPRQVWVNATDLDHDRYQELWGALSYQRQTLGHHYKTPGRAKGTAAKKRVEVAKMIRPGMTDYVIYGLGCEAGLWEPDGPDGSYEAYAGKRQERNYRRALRLRKLKQSLRGQA